MNEMFSISKSQEGMLKSVDGLVEIAGEKERIANERHINQALEIFDESAVTRLDHFIKADFFEDGRTEYRFKMLDATGGIVGDVEVACEPHDDAREKIIATVKDSKISGAVVAIEARKTMYPKDQGVARDISQTFKLPLGWKSDYEESA